MIKSDDTNTDTKLVVEDTRTKPDALANDADLHTIQKDEPAKPAPKIDTRGDLIAKGISTEPSASVEEASEILQLTANDSTAENRDDTVPVAAFRPSGHGGRFIAQPGGLVVRVED